MTDESAFSHGVRKRNDRNPTEGNTQISNMSAKELETEPESNGKLHEADTTCESFASRTESFSSENRRRPEHSADGPAVASREAIRRGLQRDALLKRKRKRRISQMCVSVLGMICLGWPSLLLFDFVLGFMPFDHVEALQYSSQETSFVGFASRLCLKIVKIARTAQITNTEYHGTITIACLAFLACLLYVLRVTTRTHKASTHYERQMLKHMLRELGKTPYSVTKQATDCSPSLE